MREAPRKRKRKHCFPHWGSITIPSQWNNLQLDRGTKAVQTPENSHQPAWENDYDPRQGKTKETLKRGASLRRDEGCIYLRFLRRRKLHILHFAAGGKAHPFCCSSFPHKIFDFAGDPFSQSDFVFQKSCICVTLVSQNPPVLLTQKSVCLPLSALIADGGATPFSASAGSKGITH